LREKGGTREKREERKGREKVEAWPLPHKTLDLPLSECAV